MRKYIQYCLIFLSAIFFILSCKKENKDFVKETITTNLPINGFLTVEPDSEISISFKVENDEQIKSIKIERIINGSSLLLVDSSFSLVAELNYTLKTKAKIEEGIEKYVFSYTDKENNSYSKEISVNVISRIFTYKTRLFGSDSGEFAIKNCLNLYSESQYTIQQADANTTLIDLVYKLDYDTVIGSPRSNEIRGYFKHPAFGIQTWANRNNTLFKKVLAFNSSDFEKIYSEEALKELDLNSSGNYIQINNYNQLIAFKTVNSKFGIIRVDSISNNTLAQKRDKFIDLTIKIQKF